MAFKKMQHRALDVAKRCDKLGKHDLAEKIRNEIEAYRMSNFNTKIAVGIALALESDLNATLEQILPFVAEWSKFGIDELREYPKINEYFDFCRRTELGYPAIEAEAEKRYQEKYEGRRD